MKSKEKPDDAFEAYFTSSLGVLHFGDDYMNSGKGVNWWCFL